ncbi:MAG: cadherin-like domain-containing protein, partial [Alphaproteobacteria bacterium]|nr:cadherin-like domain-containing protein [Alphaproteobacteria bacterium]
MAILIGNKLNNTITGTNDSDIIIGGKGDDTLNGGGGNDIITGGKGNDIINGGSGNDLIVGGGGNDTLNGGSGSDIVLGGSGKDLFIHSVSENIGASDYYDGDGGSDTLRLIVTQAQANDLAAAIAAFNSRRGNGVFDFHNYVPYMNLKIVNIEKIELNVVQTAVPIAANDTANVVEDGPVTASANVLSNDSNVSTGMPAILVTPLTGIGNYGNLTLTANGAYTYTLRNSDANVQGLFKDQIVHDVFTYRISDGLGGFSNIATLDISVKGLNDAPMAILPTVAAFAATENASLNLTSALLANVTDVDDNHTLTISSVTGDSHVTVNTGVVTFNPGTDFDHLAQGIQQTISFDYVVKDEYLAATPSIHGSIIITGVNDAPMAILPTVAAFAATENASLNLTSALLANVTDVDDNHTLTISSV